MTDWLDKPSPQALGAERSLLGGLMQDATLMLDVGRVVRAADFYRPEHGLLFRLLQQMVGSGVAVDIVTVGERILRGEGPERYGGAAYVVQLPDHCPSTGALMTYALDVREKADLRRLIDAAIDTVNRAFDGAESPIQLASGLSARVMAVAHAGGNRELWTFRDAFEDWRDHQTDVDLGSAAPPLATGYSVLDQQLPGGGLAGSKCVVVGGRPGSGKTGWTLGVVTRWAMLGRAGVFGCEEGRESMVRRALQVAGNFPQQELTDTDPMDPELSEYGTKLDGLHLLDRPTFGVEDLDRAAAFVEATRGRCSFIVADYIQRMHHKRERGESPNVYIGRTARDLLALGKKYGCVVFILSQLNREVEKRSPRKGPRTAWWQHHGLPTLGDLKESGEIEAVADLIVMPVNGPMYGDDDDLGALVVPKNREGEVGVLPLRWVGPLATYKEV